MSEDKDQLYIHADKKIDKLTGDYIEAVRKIDSLDTEQKRIADRIDKGVSQTAFKAFEMVNTLHAEVNKLTGSDQVTESRLKTLEQHMSWILRGFIIVVAAALVVAWINR